MGIQLPAELTEVAGRVGVSWPEADEDGMRQAAQAWRDAGTRLAGLAGDADRTAQLALRAVEGATGDAARGHWSAFVHPDTGHLTSPAHGCAAAADRLEHAANQIGAAKVEIVRHLVALAKNCDAAEQAAGAGNPLAAAGLDTAIRGTAANVANITANLVSAVQPASGVDINAVGEVVAANPGVAGPGQAVSPPDLVEVPRPDASPGGEPGVHGMALEPAVPGPSGVEPVGPGLGVPSSELGAGSLDATGPIKIMPDPPTPPTGLPQGGGQTAQAGLAAGVETGAPPAAPGSTVSAAQVHAPAPAPGPGLPAGGALAAPQLPVAAPGPAVSHGGAAPGVPVAGGGVSAVPPPLAAGPGPAAQPASGSTHQGEQDSAVLAFWVHMFPIGHMPVVSHQPARQLPPPEPERDYAPGLRFEPGDHPRHGLVDSAERLAAVLAGAPPVVEPAGLPATDALVRGLAEGYDPLGGQHERAWDRRYLVRLGSITAEGISPEGMEYAWPPAERYPEGGSAPGEAELLAEGTLIDRFGTPEGRVLSACATAFARRSLPPMFLAAGYRRYRVVRPVPVWRAVSAPWFGQPGGGERYRTTLSVVELVALGCLAEVSEDEGSAQ